MRKLAVLIAALLLPFATLADQPLSILNTNSGNYVSFTGAGSGTTIPLTTGPFTSGHGVCFNSTTGSITDCGLVPGAGTVTTTGSPASGNLAKFSGGTSVTNGDLSGDCTTSGTLATSCTKTGGVNFGPLATQTAPCTIAQGCTGQTALSSVPLSSFGLGIGLTGYLYGNGSGAITASTSSGSGSVVLATGATLNPAYTSGTCHPDQQAGATADVQINACNTALVALGGGIIDATGYGCTAQSIAAAVQIGDSTGHPVTLRINRCTVFTINITAGGIDAIQVFIRSALIAVGSGNPLTDNFIVSATANINSVVATYPRASQWVGLLEGFVIKGLSTATVTNGELDISGATALARVKDVAVYGSYSGVGLRITANSAATTDSLVLDDVSIDGGGLGGSSGTAGCPVKIDGTASTNLIVGVTFVGGTLTHPGSACASDAIVDIEGGASDLVQGVQFLHTRFESSNTTDIGVLVNNALNIDMNGISASANTNNGTSLVKITATANVSYNITIENLAQFNLWTNSVQDVVSGNTLTGAAFPRVTYYSVQPPTEGAWQSTRALVQPRPASDNWLLSASGAINTTETVILKSQAAIPANRLTVGSHIHIVLGGTNTSTVANVSTFAVRIGTAGTVADGLMASCATTASAASGTNNPFHVEIDLTIASSTTALGQCTVVNQGVIGIIALATNAIVPTFTAFNTAIAGQFIDVTYKSAATTTTSTFTSGQEEVFYK